MSDEEEYVSDEETSEEDFLKTPDDENIDERFRSLDEVTEHFHDEKLLGPNTYRTVQNAAKLAKEGRSLPKTKGGRGRDLA